MTIICDIDGVIYRGETLIPGSDSAIQRIVDSGVRLFLATNNSTRTPAEVSEKVERITGVVVGPESIVNSSQAAGLMLEGLDGQVFAMGADAIGEAMAEYGIRMTTEWEEAAAVVLGLDRRLSYERLTEASNAVRAGARFVATNVDPTFPIRDGFLPGAGSMVAAVETATGVKPEVAGKPYPAMRQLLRSRGVGSAWVIGDRTDTDIALASEENDWRSVLVETGVTPPGSSSSADHVARDLSAAVDLVFRHLEEG